MKCVKNVPIYGFYGIVKEMKTWLNLKFDNEPGSEAEIRNGCYFQGANKHAQKF